MFGGDSRSPARMVRWVEMLNVGGQEIPAFGACEIVGEAEPEVGSELTPLAGRTVLRVQRPSCDSAARVAFCGQTPIGAGLYGWGTIDSPLWALCETTTNGKAVGTEKDSFILKKEKNGFVVLGGDYNGATRITTPVGPTRWYMGVLESSMCSTALEGNVAELEYIGPCCEEERITGTKTAKNKFGEAGCGGENVLAMRYCDDSGETPQDSWLIVKVQKHEVEPYYNAYYDDCSLNFRKTKIAVNHCCPSPTLDTITMYEHTVVGNLTITKEFIESMDPANSECWIRIKGRYSRFCAFTEQSLDAETTFSSLQAVQARVSNGVTDDGTCLEETLQYIWVICAADPDTPYDILCLDACATGSGSGSGGP